MGNSHPSNVGRVKSATHADVGKYGVLSSLTVLPVEIFYLDRAYHLTQRSPVVLIIASTLLLVTVTCAIGFTAVSKDQIVAVADKVNFTSRSQAVTLTADYRGVPLRLGAFTCKLALT